MIVEPSHRSRHGGEVTRNNPSARFRRHLIQFLSAKEFFFQLPVDGARQGAVASVGQGLVECLGDDREAPDRVDYATRSLLDDEPVVVVAGNCEEADNPTGAESMLIGGRGGKRW